MTLTASLGRRVRAAAAVALASVAFQGLAAAQYLEQGGGGVATEVHGHFVDLVE